MKKVNVHISDIINSQRIDVAYFTDKTGEANFVPLSRYVEIKGGKRIPKGKSFSSEKTNYLYLRLSEIDNSGIINYDTLKCISEDLFNTLQRYEVKNDQVVFSIAGTIGRVFVIKGIPSNKRIVLTENCAKIQPKTEQVLSDFISILLNCSFVQKQVERNKIQTTIPKIGLDRIAKLKIPEIHSLDFQKKIITIYQNAQKERLNRINEAKSLLNSIDDYILDALQVDGVKNSGKGNSFRVSISDVIGSRLDVSYYKDKFEMASSKYDNTKLYNIVDIDPKISFIGGNADDVISFIPMECIDEISGEIINRREITIGKSKGYTKFEENDLLWAKITPCMQNGKSAIARGLKNGVGCGSTEFYVIRPKDGNKVLIDYVYLILRHHDILFAAQTSFGGSAGQQRVPKQYLKSIIIPIPDISVQKEIVDTVYSIKAKAKQLQENGNLLLEEAKLKIENIILG